MRGKGGTRGEENLLDLHSTASDVYRENQISLGQYNLIWCLGPTVVWLETLQQKLK